MRLVFDGPIEYSPGPFLRGRCGLWLYRGDEGGAFVVLTALEHDAGPGLSLALPAIVDQVRLEHGLQMGRTGWAVRKSLGGHELICLYDPRTRALSLASRASVQARVGDTLPVPDDNPNVF